MAKSAKQRKLERDNRAWRRDLIEEAGHCQLPDCPGEWPHLLTVHEIACGHGGRSLAYSRRLAVLVACWHCNSERLTDYTIWPIERQAALQCVLCEDIATVQQVLECINFCRGRAPTAISAPSLDLGNYFTEFGKVLFTDRAGECSLIDATEADHEPK